MNTTAEAYDIARQIVDLLKLGNDMASAIDEAIDLYDDPALGNCTREECHVLKVMARVVGAWRKRTERS